MNMNEYPTKQPDTNKLMNTHPTIRYKWINEYPTKQPDIHEYERIPNQTTRYK